MSSEGEARYEALQRRAAEVVREHLTEQAIDAQPSDARREYLTKLRPLLERAAEDMNDDAVTELVVLRIPFRAGFEAGSRTRWGTCDQLAGALPACIPLASRRAGRNTQATRELRRSARPSARSFGRQTSCRASRALGCGVRARAARTASTPGS